MTTGIPQMAGKPGFDQWGRATIGPRDMDRPPPAIARLERLLGMAELNRVVEAAKQALKDGKPFKLDGATLRKARRADLDLEQVRTAVLGETFRRFLAGYDVPKVPKVDVTDEVQQADPD